MVLWIIGIYLIFLLWKILVSKIKKENKLEITKCSTNWRLMRLEIWNVCIMWKPYRDLHQLYKLEATFFVFIRLLNFEENSNLDWFRFISCIYNYSYYQFNVESSTFIFLSKTLFSMSQFKRFFFNLLENGIIFLLRFVLIFSLFVQI